MPVRVILKSKLFVSSLDFSLTGFNTESQNLIIILCHRPIGKDKHTNCLQASQQKLKA
jgi:hypothetical protein